MCHGGNASKTTYFHRHILSIRHNMALKAEYFKKTFLFNFRARTSRGVMRDKTSWFVKIYRDSDPSIFGIAECGPLPGLSVDAVPDFEDQLAACLEKIRSLPEPDIQKIHEIVPATLPS